MSHHLVDDGVVVDDASGHTVRGEVIIHRDDSVHWHAERDAKGVHFDAPVLYRSARAPGERQFRQLTRAPWYHPLAHRNEKLISYYAVGNWLVGEVHPRDALRTLEWRYRVVVPDSWLRRPGCYESFEDVRL